MSMLILPLKFIIHQKKKITSQNSTKFHSDDAKLLYTKNKS